jgi:hypothetical protein
MTRPHRDSRPAPVKARKATHRARHRAGIRRMTVRAREARARDRLLRRVLRLLRRAPPFRAVRARRIKCAAQRRSRVRASASRTAGSIRDVRQVSPARTRAASASASQRSRSGSALVSVRARDATELYRSVCRDAHQRWNVAHRHGLDHWNVASPSSAAPEALTIAELAVKRTYQSDAGATLLSLT